MDTTVPCLAVVLLSIIAIVTCSQLLFENIKYKIPVINNPSFKFHTAVSSLMKSLTAQHHPARDNMNHSSVQSIQLTGHLVGDLVTVIVSQCL